MICCGLLLLAAALALIAYNIRVQHAAGTASQKTLEALLQQMARADRDPRGELYDPRRAPPGTPFPSATPIPDYVLNPRMEMPEKKVENSSYIATLSIPSLGLELPVHSAWNYSNLETAPCRYSGSAYTGDLIICAHNYDVHFGNLKYLNPGDRVTLTDMDGNRFTYEVTETETIGPYAEDALNSGAWELTLFTCTVGGATRVTVRCAQIRS